MLTIICTTKDCANENVQYNFLGNPEFVKCGGCKEHLTGTDFRSDPQIQPLNLETTQE